MLQIFWNLFSWMPPALEIICRTVLIVFLVICLAQIIRFIIDIVKVIIDIGGGLLGKVVDLFK